MTMVNAMANDLINSLDEIAFEPGPSDTKKLESMQNLLYQYSQINDAMSVRADEATLEETQLYNGFRR